MSEYHGGRDAYVGIGSNLDDPVAHVRRAVRELDGLPKTRRVTVSSLYRSPPMGPADQPDYCNAVARLATWLSPLGLLEALQGIERSHGRLRHGQQWGARTLDLDLLLYEDEHIRSRRLTVPHYGLHERAFVLYPLLEIAPGLEIPGHGPLQQLAAGCPRGGLQRLQGLP